MMTLQYLVRRRIERALEVHLREMREDVTPGGATVAIAA